jgi:hypothetical protein
MPYFNCFPDILNPRSGFFSRRRGVFNHDDREVYENNSKFTSAELQDWRSNNCTHYPTSTNGISHSPSLMYGSDGIQYIHNSTIDENYFRGFLR